MDEHPLWMIQLATRRVGEESGNKVGNTTVNILPGWWFGTCVFPFTGKNNPNWRSPSFFRVVGWNHQPVMMVVVVHTVNCHYHNTTCFFPSYNHVTIIWWWSTGCSHVVVVLEPLRDYDPSAGFRCFLLPPIWLKKRSCGTPKYVGKTHVGVFQLFPLKHLEANDSDSIFTRYVKIGCAEDSPTTSWDITAAPWSKSNGSNWPPISGGSGRLPLQRYNRMLTIDRHPFTIWRKTGMFLTFFHHVIVVIVSGWCQLMPVDAPVLMSWTPNLLHPGNMCHWWYMSHPNPWNPRGVHCVCVMRSPIFSERDIPCEHSVFHSF